MTGRQIELKYINNHIHTLLNSLLISFYDESWPVREATSLSSSIFISNLYTLYTNNFNNIILNKINNNNEMNNNNNNNKGKIYFNI